MERNTIVIIDPRQDVRDLLERLIRQNAVMDIHEFKQLIRRRCTTFPTIARATRAKDGEWLYIEGILRNKFYPKKDACMPMTFRIFKLHGDKIIFGKARPKPKRGRRRK